MYKPKWKLTLLVLIVATLFAFTWNAMSCTQVKGIQEVIKLIIGQKKIFAQMLCGFLGVCSLFRI